MDTATWTSIVADLSNRDVDKCVKAAKRMHSEADASDIPILLRLLQSDDFFIREAASFPLAELAGAAVLLELFVAYQLGFDEGYDNDGFTVALLEIPHLHPIEARQALEHLVESAEEPIRGHAVWLLEFCSQHT